MDDVRQFIFRYFLLIKLFERKKTCKLCLQNLNVAQKNPKPPRSWLGFTAFDLVCQSLWCNLDCKGLQSFFADLLSLILDVAGTLCCTAVSALIPHSKLTLAQCIENRGKALKCDGLDSFRRNSQRAWLEKFLPSTSGKHFGSKSKGQTEAVSLHTQTFEISNSFACCFQFKSSSCQVLTVLLKVL